MANAKKYTMDELLAANEEVSKKITTGDTVKGTVLSIKKHEILIDLGPQGVGLVPRREVSFARNLKEGDEVTTSVIDSEMKDGYVLLSLRKAVKDKSWDEIQAKLDGGESSVGLGLAVAKWIADRHDIKISVKSKPGAGSTFTLTIPSL